VDYNEMCRMVRELSDNSILIISEDDREFVLGILLQLEMEEKVPASYGERVARIYRGYQENQFL
jgi:hypothetical protein